MDSAPLPSCLNCRNLGCPASSWSKSGESLSRRSGGWAKPPPPVNTKVYTALANDLKPRVKIGEGGIRTHDAVIQWRHPQAAMRLLGINMSANAPRDPPPWGLE